MDNALLIVVCLSVVVHDVLGHSGCPRCKKIDDERCKFAGTKSSGLCRKIAQSVCPTAILQGKLPPKPLKPKPVEICGCKSSSHAVEVSSKHAEVSGGEDEGIFDLISGILTAVHPHSKANVKRAREKELKEKLLGKKIYD